MVPIDPQPLPRPVRLDQYTKRTTRLLSALALVYLVTFSIQSIWPVSSRTTAVRSSLISILTSASEHRAKTRSHDVIDEIVVQTPAIAFENS